MAAAFGNSILESQHVQSKLKQPNHLVSSARPLPALPHSSNDLDPEVGLHMNGRSLSAHFILRIKSSDQFSKFRSESQMLGKVQNVHLFKQITMILRNVANYRHGAFSFMKEANSS